MTLFFIPALVYFLLLAPTSTLGHIIPRNTRSDRRDALNVFRAAKITAVGSGGVFTGLTPTPGIVIGCITGSDSEITAAYGIWNCTLYLINPTAYTITQVGLGADGEITDAQCNAMIGQVMDFGTRHGTEDYPLSYGEASTYGYTPAGCPVNSSGETTSLQGGGVGPTSTTDYGGSSSTSTSQSTSPTTSASRIPDNSGGGGSNGVLSSIGAKAGIGAAAAGIVMAAVIIYLIYRSCRKRRFEERLRNTPGSFEMDDRFGKP